MNNEQAPSATITTVAMSDTAGTTNGSRPPTPPNRYAILDESTAANDTDNERRMYQIIKDVCQVHAGLYVCCCGSLTQSHTAVPQHRMAHDSMHTHVF